MRNKIIVMIVVMTGVIALGAFRYSGKPLDDLHAELVLDAKTMLGEGSIWHPTENKIILDRY